MTANLTTMEAARSAVSSLLSGGVSDVVLAPGSRSAPLAYALAEAEADGAVRLHVRIDERDAAFTALGLALGSGRPSAVVTTSGTAVGELLPAVMEANHAAVPLIVVSADRPEELRGSGANQTTTQPDLFGDHARFAVDVAAGEDPARAVSAAISAATGALENIPAGPVQLNLAFRDPLIPDAAEPRSTVQHLVEPRTPANPVELLESGPTLLNADKAARTVVVAGHGAGEAASVFAHRLGLPLLAEPSSNARFGPNAIASYRLLLEHIGPAIDRVVLFGRPTLSRPVAALLARTDVEKAIYLPGPASWFEPGRRTELVITNLSDLLDFAGPGLPQWLERWQTADQTATAAIRTLLATEPLNGLSVADTVWEQTNGNLVLGSSNPIRDVDLMASTGSHPLDVYANRGLAGIDGMLSTASGIALAAGIPTRLLAGDLTFLHDVGGLLLGPDELVPDLQIVVLNDGGGGIFTTLEHGGLDDSYAATVERLFGTPHTADLASICHGYGVPHTLVDSVESLDDVLGQPISGRSVVEIRTRRDALRDVHARIRSAVAVFVAVLD